MISVQGAVAAPALAAPKPHFSVSRFAAFPAYAAAPCRPARGKRALSRLYPALPQGRGPPELLKYRFIPGVKLRFGVVGERFTAATLEHTPMREVVGIFKSKMDLIRCE